MADSKTPFSSGDFLGNYWQQSPLLMRKEFALEGIINADELAGLSMEDAVESRLISLDTVNDQWHLKHGPFSEQDFESLPDSHWTLLVQAVDHWVPEVRNLLKRFHFLPQWRIDDIMVSFASDQGGVGPHFDQYDVFLIQLEGKREWRIGQLCDADTDLVDQMPVKLLTDFEEQDRWVLDPGDVLYLPPGLAHWGTSIGNSMTISVGFRAPAESEIVSDFGHFLSSCQDDFIRYEDPEISDRSDRPHKIEQNDIERLQTILRKYADNPALLSKWFGQYMTEPKYDDMAVETGDWTESDFIEHFRHTPLYRNPSSRLAFCGSSLFVDGQTVETQLTELDLNTLCDAEIFEYATISQTQTKEFQYVLWSLLNVGAVFFEN